jgi:hypothetical protein
MTYTQIIRDIGIEIEEAHAKRYTYASVRQLQQSALHHLAALNGWRTGPGVRAFDPDQIGKRSGRRRGQWHEALDHVIYFRAEGRCAAILTQPYDHGGVIDAARALAAQCGVACHVAPQPRASIHYPGHTLAIVLTGPGHVMRWLPEQTAKVLVLRRSGEEAE